MSGGTRIAVSVAAGLVLPSFLAGVIFAPHVTAGIILALIIGGLSFAFARLIYALSGSL